jgi:hypothetical protein
MTFDFGGFQQPDIFVIGSSVGSVILWRSNDACFRMQEDTWCFVFLRRIDVDLSAIS